MDPAQSHISNCNNHGTPFYAPPETALRSQATKSSDVFSFGIVMIQMYK